MKIGLITYHSAYNFGSVLQAYATQEMVARITGSCEIINYRTKEQRKIYSIFVWNRGKRFIYSIVTNTLILFRYRKKKERQESYERLFNEIFSLSEECTEPEDVYRMWNKYDVIISGSDQIWNKHSKELHNVAWKYMMPYLLCGYKGKKISYASSLSCMNDEEIVKILPYIDQFDYLSFREKSTAEKMAKICSIKVSEVVDPTFLLSMEDWIKRFGLKKIDDEKYLLFYALNRRRDIKLILPIIEKYAKSRGLIIKMISPLGFFRGNKIVRILENVNPIDFLSLIYNATTVITDSYHGTILSVNFQKDIFSICGRNPSDFRKTDILNRIGLDGRIIYDLNDMLIQKYDVIDYSEVNKTVQKLRDESMLYLKDAFSHDHL